MNFKTLFGKRIVTSTTAIVFLFLLLALAIPSIAIHVSAVSCQPAGGTGLTTLMVASSYEDIHDKNINAAGCDIGIYVPPGTHDVEITGVAITGANDHAVFVQDASHITISNSLVKDNGASSHHCATPTSTGCVAEDKAIQLVGTTHSLVARNVVKDNSADGGIGVADDGPSSVGGDPAALSASATTAQPSSDVAVIGNFIVSNENGCGIVIAGYDWNVGVSDINVAYNTVIGVEPTGAPNSGPYGGPGSFYGQIVVAGDGPYTPVSEVAVIRNEVVGSLLPGIVVHSNVFGDTITNTLIWGNLIAENGYYPPFFGPPGDTNAPLASTLSNGISVVAEVGVQPPSMPNPVISHTLIIDNRVFDDNNGVWLCGTTHTTISDLEGNPTHHVVTCPAGGT